MLYFQTALKAWKARRIIRNPMIRVVPSAFRGDPKGDWVSARVAKLDGEDAEKARKIYIEKLGFITRFFFLFEKIWWGKIAYFSITVDPS